MSSSDTINEAVQVSVPALVRLSQYSSSIPFLSKEILARQTGNYQSPFKGRGMEFDESRLYQPGDDIRNIDWRVTARTGKTHTKLFREERERPVFLWIDLRAPMFFATRGQFKSVMAARLASLLAWSAAHHGDRVGSVIFSDDIHHELKPHRGKTGVLRLINQLVDHPVWQNFNTAKVDKNAGSRALIRLRRVARPGSLIFLISDFRYLDPAAQNQLIRLSQHNDVVMIYIHDPLEEKLPPAGRYRISDGKDELTIDSFDKSRVKKHQQRYLNHLEQLKQLSRKGNIYFLSCSTVDDPVSLLQVALTARSRK